MSAGTSFEIPHDWTAYAGQDWNRAGGWIWRYEIGRQRADCRLTFAFEKAHREDGTILFLATFRDEDGSLAERVRNLFDASPEQLAAEITARFLAMSGTMQPPAHVVREMREHLGGWIAQQRSGDAAGTSASREAGSP